MANWAALSLSLVLITWAGSMRALTGTWLNPAAFYSLWWCFAGILPLVLAPNEPVGANVMIWLIASSIVVAAGAAVGNWGFKTRTLAVADAPSIIEVKVFTLALITALSLGLGSSISFIAASGIPLSDVLQIDKLVVVSNQMYFQRYAETGAPAPPAVSQALLPFVYFAPALGGVMFVIGRSYRHKLLALGSLAPAIAVTVLQTTKAALLFGFVLWFSCYFAARLRMGKVAVFTRSHIAAAALVGGVVVVFFFAVGLARLASTDVSLLNVVMVKLVTSAFGHMTVFSQWLAEYTTTDFNPSLGKITFAGPLEMIGLSQRIPGLFDSIIDLVAGETSNIFTGFRPLIQDFGIPAALLILGLVGFVGGLGFRLVAAGRWSAVPLLLIAYVTIFWSPITWFWIYNSLTVSVFAVGFLVLFVRVWRGLVSGSSLTRPRAAIDSISS